MSKIKENRIFQLISTLNKAEKRHFQLFAKRNQQESSLLFLQVFDVYSKYGMVADTLLLEKIPSIKPSQLSNIRNNLYRQLLASLRLQHQKTNADIAIRQEIDFAKVLYNKGLYRQALQLLNKAKALAQQQNSNILALEILFFEKAIESQNITKSIGNRAADLIQESEFIYSKLKDTLHYSNLDLELYAYYLKNGFCKSDQEVERFDGLFLKKLNDVSISTEDFYPQLYSFQCLCWYNYIKQDVEQYYSTAKQWVQLFQDFPEMATERPTIYLKGIHNCISGAFMNTDHQGYRQYFDLLKHFPKSHPKKLTWNEQGVYDLYYNMHEIDLHFDNGRFDEYLSKRQSLEILIETNPYHWDAHRIAVFRYKLACLFIGVRAYKNAIDEFNEIRQLYRPGSKSMVLRFVRILSAFCHLEMGNMRLVNSTVQTLKKDLANSKSRHEPLEKLLVRLLDRFTRIGEWDKKQEIQATLVQVNALQKDPYAQVAFLHFFAEEWLSSLLFNKDAQDVIAEKAAASH
ncbi:MAG: hypothetical protein KTR13_03340 [Saprospiraceae bacterium]|nr:hypothetical protein [Saprospiraceae bacterium]